MDKNINNACGNVNAINQFRNHFSLNYKCTPAVPLMLSRGVSKAKLLSMCKKDMMFCALFETRAYTSNCTRQLAELLFEA